MTTNSSLHFLYMPIEPRMNRWMHNMCIKAKRVQEKRTARVHWIHWSFEVTCALCSRCLCLVFIVYILCKCLGNYFGKCNDIFVAHTGFVCEKRLMPEKKKKKTKKKRGKTTTSHNTILWIFIYCINKRLLVTLIASSFSDHIYHYFFSSPVHFVVIKSSFCCYFCITWPWCSIVYAKCVINWPSNLIKSLFIFTISSPFNRASILVLMFLFYDVVWRPFQSPINHQWLTFEVQ